MRLETFSVVVQLSRIGDETFGPQHFHQMSPFYLHLVVHFLDSGLRHVGIPDPDAGFLWNEGQQVFPLFQQHFRLHIGQNVHHLQLLDRQLGFGMNKTDGFDLVVEQLKTDGILGCIRKDINDKASHRKLTWLKHKIGFLEIELVHEIMKTIEIELLTYPHGP